jgi:hypothetical protein
MIILKYLQSRFDSLESRTVMSAGVTTAHVAHAIAHHGHAAVGQASDTTVSLTGVADGYYTSTEKSPHDVTKYNLTASGTISPIGASVVTGSFKTSETASKETGRLTIVGPLGDLKLKLREPGPIVAGASNAADSSTNPGVTVKKASTSASAGPIILVNNFTYTIVRGTGQYAHDHGSGTVVITTTPGDAGSPAARIGCSHRR